MNMWGPIHTVGTVTLDCRHFTRHTVKRLGVFKALRKVAALSSSVYIVMDAANASTTVLGTTKAFPVPVLTSIHLTRGSSLWIISKDPIKICGIIYLCGTSLRVTNTRPHTTLWIQPAGFLGSKFAHLWQELPDELKLHILKFNMMINMTIDPTRNDWTGYQE